jgi:hypothetical protein
MAKVSRSKLLRILNSSKRNVFKALLNECSSPLFSTVNVNIEFNCGICVSTTTTTTTQPPTTTTTTSTTTTTTTAMQTTTTSTTTSTTTQATTSTTTTTTTEAPPANTPIYLTYDDGAILRIYGLDTDTYDTPYLGNTTIRLSEPEFIGPDIAVSQNRLFVSTRLYLYVMALVDFPAGSPIAIYSYNTDLVVGDPKALESISDTSLVAIGDEDVWRIDLTSLSTFTRTQLFSIPASAGISTPSGFDLLYNPNTETLIIGYQNADAPQNGSQFAIAEFTLNGTLVAGPYTFAFYPGFLTSLYYANNNLYVISGSSNDVYQLNFGDLTKTYINTVTALPPRGAGQLQVDYNLPV